MGGYVDKLQQKAGDVLRPDERLVGAIRTQPRGSAIGTGVGGLVGGAVAGRLAKGARTEAGEESLASKWPDGRFAVGMSNQRLLMFSYSAMGKPKDLVHEIPLDNVASIDLAPKKLTKGVRFSFTDGSAVEVECAKLEKVDDFVDAYQQVRSSPTG